MKQPSLEIKKGSFTFLKPYLLKYWRAFGLAILFLSVETTCDLLQPTILSRLIDLGVARRDLREVLTLGMLMLTIAGIGALGASGRNIISSRVSQNFGADLRQDLYQRVVFLPFADLDRLETATLITRLTNDVTQVQTMINGLMRMFLKAPLLALGGITLAVALNPRLSLVLVVLLPLEIFLMVTNIRTSFPFFKQIQESIDRVNGVMRENLSGVRVVKAFNGANQEEARFSRVNTELARSTTRAMKVMALFSPMTVLAVNLGIASILWIGGLDIRRGTAQVGQVVAFINYMTLILQGITMMSFIFTMFVRARASAERIAEVLEVPVELHSQSDTSQSGIGQSETSGGRPVSGWGGRSLFQPSVRFDRVSLRYDRAERPALRDISFSCADGTFVGIIGSTGSGKSSLVRLIPRFYSPSDGAIFIDGRDIQTLNPQELRSHIALVPQKSVLFTGTIEENIRWGNPSATDDQLRWAVEMAQARDFIEEMPQGYQSLVGRGGYSLSGGQRQRLAIARALIRRPAILLLDDSLSAVDAVTEAAIRANLQGVLEGTTVFMVAQRISSVKETDQILVLDEGAIVGAGTHGDLLQTCEVYRDIYRSQVGDLEAIHG